MKREDILALLYSQRLESPPLFSDLNSVIKAGPESKGLQFHETYHDALKMARAAANVYRGNGFKVDA